MVGHIMLRFGWILLLCLVVYVCRMSVPIMLAPAQGGCCRQRNWCKYCPPLGKHFLNRLLAAVVVTLANLFLLPLKRTPKSQCPHPVLRWWWWCIALALVLSACSLLSPLILSWLSEGSCHLQTSPYLCWKWGLYSFRLWGKCSSLPGFG